MGEVFELLKRALRAQGMSYEDLAQAMQLSLPTIKRLFSDQDCKFSRLLAVCDVLEISMVDLMDTAQRKNNCAEYLAPEVEAAFAEYPALFYFYALLREPLSTAEISEYYQLSDADIILYCRDLERLGMINTGYQGRVTLLHDAPFKVHRDGALQAAYSAINAQFIQQTLNRNGAEENHYESLSRQLRPETAAQINAEIEQLTQRIGRFARQDRLTSKQHEMKTYKWAFACAQVSLLSFIELEKHRDRNA